MTHANAFPLNAWYAAAWSHEVEHELAVRNPREQIGRSPNQFIPRRDIGIERRSSQEERSFPIQDLRVEGRHRSARLTEERHREMALLFFCIQLERQSSAFRLSRPALAASIVVSQFCLYTVCIREKTDDARQRLSPQCLVCRSLEP